MANAVDFMMEVGEVDWCSEALEKGQGIQAQAVYGISFVLLGL